MSELIKATLSGSADRVFGYDKKWYAAARVTLLCPDKVRIEVEHFHDSLLTYEDDDLVRLFGLFVAEIAVDNWLPTPWYYIRPMDFAWAVDIIRRAAVECKEREIRRPKLYESLDFLEKQLDEKSRWLVRRYRRELRWDRRTYQEKEELREILRVTTRGIQFAWLKKVQTNHYPLVLCFDNVKNLSYFASVAFRLSEKFNRHIICPVSTHDFDA